MESYADEIAILHYLLPFFSKSKAIVSFNGKTFDVPLIKTRYMLNKVYGFPVDIPVLDLLTPARRIFRNVFENCTLQTLEKEVIGFERIDDTPGYMIPEIYFTFQKEGEWSRIPQVIEHNKLDIISMYALLFIFSNIYTMIENKNYNDLNKQSLFNIANHLYRINIESFLDLSEYLKHDLLEDESVFKKFSIILKRHDDWQKAIHYWEKSGSLFSLQELAKYYEHKEKDFSKAKIFCEKAFSLLEKSYYSPRKDKLAKAWQDKYTQEFNKRHTRLLNKEKRNFNK
jgi:hypothetical protein